MAGGITVWTRYYTAVTHCGPGPQISGLLTALLSAGFTPHTFILHWNWFSEPLVRNDWSSAAFIWTGIYTLTGGRWLNTVVNMDLSTTGAIDMWCLGHRRGNVVQCPFVQEGNNEW